MKIQLSQRPRLTAAIATIAAIGGALVFAPLATAGADSSSGSQNKPTIVLVHGAWADGSSWDKVSEQLQAKGYAVRVPPNNLRGVASDSDHLVSFLTTISGPIVLVGHSYGGVVITNAATRNSQVRSLVYVDAYIPDEGDTLIALTHPPSVFAQDPANVLDFVPFPGAPQGVVDTYVKPSIFGEAMANEGFSGREVGVLAASQRPLSSQAFGEPSGVPAWRSIPSWAVVGEQDRAIPIADQLSMAKAAGAHVVKVDAPHLAMLTDARAVTDVIVKAAESR
jgi:pimeloyl-ACP methyl ester carboxylesterase